MKWISTKDKMPTENGQYLTAYLSGFDKQYSYAVTKFALNLYSVDYEDFPIDEYEDVQGFYYFDSSCGHYYKIDDILYWANINNPDESLIDEMPSADIVEVVRCKDCIHRQSYRGSSVMWCGKTPAVDCDYYVSEDFFCADGERKETE